MSNDKKGIVIELSNIRAKKFHNENGTSNHILLNKYYEKIADLIADRIKEVDSYRQQGFDIDNINEIKMHDAILVYGSRGNGKSTVMINLKDFITDDYSKDVENATEIKSKVKIFETIDPTIQEEDEDFLLVILSAILKEVENYQEGKYSNRDGFYDSLENVLKIVEATRSNNKDNIDIFDKFYGLKSGVGLAEELHNLFKATKDIFGVEILVIPIDDVDMNLKQGYQIADSIRKYMSSPYIIPIVAFNIRQMRVVTKYNKYKEFGLKIDNELELEELSFLRSLPNDYLSKIFPPNRRIYLKSVFEILKEVDDENKNLEIDKKELIIFKKDDLSVQSFNMASLVSELFYESHYNPDGFDDSTFLSTRSMRNFFNDCYCVLSSLTEKKLEEKNNHEYDKEYTINRKIIKDRLSPDDIPSFVTKEHALTWIWNEYIKLAKENLESENNLFKNYNWAKMVTETLPEDNSAEIINKKTYARVWLQEYYVIEESIKYKENETINNQSREYIHEKKADIIGALELAMRSYIPMYLFESIVKNRNIEYENSDLIYLKSFSSRSLQGIAYELSMMEVTLFKERDSKLSPKPIGSIVVDENILSISEKEFNIPFLFKVSNQDKLNIQGEENNQIYILSIFKAIAFFIELSKIYKNQKIDEEKRETLLKDLIERYRVNLPTIENAVDMTEDYFKECLEGSVTTSFQDILEIEFTDSSFGVLEISSFSKKIVNFFMIVRDNIKEERISFDKKNDDSEFYTPLITYFTSFTQALFLSLFNSIKKDDILSIQSSNESQIIFRKNSLYGTKKNDEREKEDHLYQENICNLIKITEENDRNNNSPDKKIAKIQKDFNELFKYINNDIPFFKFLINKAKFLTKMNTNYEESKKNASD